MRHWYESEEYQLEMTQRQLDFDEKNMSPESRNLVNPCKSDENFVLGGSVTRVGHSWGRQIESWKNLEMSQRQRLREEETWQESKGHIPEI